MIDNPGKPAGGIELKMFPKRSVSATLPSVSETSAVTPGGDANEPSGRPLESRILGNASGRYSGTGRRATFESPHGVAIIDDAKKHAKNNRPLLYI